jgi:hypothetical protein
MTTNNMYTVNVWENSILKFSQKYSSIFGALATLQEQYQDYANKGNSLTRNEETATGICYELEGSADVKICLFRGI